MTAYQVVPTELKKYKFSENAFLPKIVTVPLSQERKCICKNLVKIGDVVKEGDLIAVPENEKDDSANIHSPIPGKVVDIISTLSTNGHYEKAVKIKLEGAFSYTGKKLEENKVDEKSSKKIISKFAEKGIINSFIASKPESLAKQINELENKNERCLVVRLYDEDNTRLADSLLTKFFIEKIIDGVKITAKALETEKIILVADKKTDLEKINELIKDTQIKICSVHLRNYPLGLKREIINRFNKSMKKTCNYSLSVKDLFVDSYTMYNVGNALKYDIPLISTYVQFTGNCLPASCFLKVKVGFSLKEIIEQLGGFVHEPSLIVINGSVCGKSVNSLDVPITKNVKSVEFISKKNPFDYQLYNCINCGNCRYVCQVKLSPDVIFSYMQNKDNLNEAFIKSVKLCTECGLCNTVCPARLPLVQTISILKEQSAGKENEK